MAINEKEREALMKLRGHLAHAKQCAPYYIFGNDVIDQLLEKRPQTLKELSTIKGFPADGKRVQKWGKAIVDFFALSDKNPTFTFDTDSEGDIVVGVQFKKLSSF